MVNFVYRGSDGVTANYVPTTPTSVYPTLYTQTIGVPTGAVTYQIGYNPGYDLTLDEINGDLKIMGGEIVDFVEMLSVNLLVDGYIEETFEFQFIHVSSISLSYDKHTYNQVLDADPYPLLNSILSNEQRGRKLETDTSRDLRSHVGDLLTSSYLA